MSGYIERQEYTDFQGIDLKADNVNRGPLFSPDGGKNIIYGDRGEIRKLPGNQKIVTNLYSSISSRTPVSRFYGNTPSGTGVEQLLIGSGSGLKAAEEKSLMVTYSGAGDASIKFGADAGGPGVYIYVNGSLVYSSTTANLSIVNLSTAINALSGFSSTYTSPTGADFLENFYRTPLVDLTIGVTFEFKHLYLSTVTGGSSALLANTGTFSEKETLVSHCLLNNVLYFPATESTYNSNVIGKYDGHYFYRAGCPMPTMSLSSYNWAGTGPLAPGDIVTVGARTKFVDYGGNTVYSDWVFQTITISAGNDGFYATVALANMNAAIPFFSVPSSNQFGVTTIAVTVDPSSRFKVGDKLTVEAGSGIQERTVTALGALSISVDAATDARTTDFLTHRLTVEVWCTTVVTSGTKNEAGPFYKIGETTVSNTGSKQVYRPQTDTDAVMTATREILTSIRRWNTDTYLVSGPPAGKFLSSFQGSLVFADYSQKNLVHFSDQEGPEQFDLAVNNFTVEGEITAIGPSKEFMAVFKEKNTDVLVGDLKGYSIRVDRVSDKIGCVSHTSIAPVTDSNLFFLSHLGPYSLSSGSMEPLGGHSHLSGLVSSRIEPVFSKKRTNTYKQSGSGSEYLATHRSYASLWKDKNIYVLYVPLENPATYGETGGFSENTTYAYDYSRGVWLPVWSIVADSSVECFGRFFFLQRDMVGTAARGDVYSVSKTNSVRDFFGNEAKYCFGWWHNGEPSQFKKHLRLRFFTHETAPNSSFTLDLKVESDFQEGTYTTDIAGITFTIGREKKVKLTGQKSRSIKVTISNDTDGEDISINGVVLEWTNPYRTGLKE